VEFLGDLGRERKVYLQADAFGGYDGIYVAPAAPSVPEQIGAPSNSGASGTSPASHGGRHQLSPLRPWDWNRPAWNAHLLRSTRSCRPSLPSPPAIVEVACWAHYPECSFIASTACRVLFS
jgi:hypothetical protein